ncbi:MAG: flagellar basal body P-ring protein FlgI [Myxococcales bacterium]|nr:flagellar basal body P-ring protein FlgI [Myxococcales bacterium]
MKRRNHLLFVLALAVVLFWPGSARADKIRDLCEVNGARDNQLVGFGIVTGLAGTGDDLSVPFAAQSVLSMLRRLGIQVDPKQLRLRNVAAVMVTATLPPFAKAGTHLDVAVSSVGNARSLSSGVLVQAVLKGPDQKTYAVAQGPVLLGGFDAKGASGSSIKSGSTTSGRVPEGAIIEREVVGQIVDKGQLRFDLRTPGFAVAARIAEAIDKKLGKGTAQASDGGAVVVRVPDTKKTRIVELIAEIEELEVVPVRKARVVINERTGTIVAGGDVRLAPAAVVHGSLTVIVRETPEVSQPTAPFGKGSTAVVPRTEIETKEGGPSGPSVTYMGGSPTLAEVASALGLLGLSPRELAGVLQALRGAGALEAEVVVQ